MFIIISLICLTSASASAFLGYWLGFDQGRRSMRAVLLQSKAATCDPDELAKWRDVIETL